MRRKRTDSGIDVSNGHEDMSSLPSPPRSASMRHNKRSVDIKKISGPMQLLSTTNMLTYNAPDVAVIQAQRKASRSVSSGSSSASVNDDDASSTSSRFRDTHSTDASSVGSISPVASPHNEEKMAFFESSPAFKGASTLRRSISTLEVRQPSLAEESPEDLQRSESPAIPQRHPSHSKKAHTELARKRSMQVMSSSSMNRAHSVASTSSARRESRSSLDFFNGNHGEPVPSITTTPATTPPAHPFGKELEQLDEVAEEFTAATNDAERKADMQAMQQRGLARFCAADYIDEISPLFSSYVHTHLSVPQPVGWI